MSYLYIYENNRFRTIELHKRVMTFGSGQHFDFQVSTESPGPLMTFVSLDSQAHEPFKNVAQKSPQNSMIQVFPATGSSKATKVFLNQRPLSETKVLRFGDRLSWNNSEAIFLPEIPISPHQESREISALRWLEILERLGSQASDSNALEDSLKGLIQDLVEVSDSEIAYLMTEQENDSAWEILASHLKSNVTFTSNTKELLSHTVLEKAIQNRDCYYIENIIGHPMAQTQSIMTSRFFSIAAFPLIIAGEITGAAFLATQTPGKSVRKNVLREIHLLLTQAALIVRGLKATSKVLAPTKRSVSYFNSSENKVAPCLSSRSTRYLDLLDRVQKLAATPMSLLILGETGTGKEVIARHIHQQSDRGKEAFVAVNCAAIPAPLLESTLFGHEKGAFTGAIKSKDGKFRLAHGGTLLLDEIGDLPLDLQSKLLRVLQESEIEPVGAQKAQKINVRILAATHQDLESKVKKGEFREDLYFRLKGALLQIPSLKERKEDLLELAHFFLKRVNPALTLSQGAQIALLAYDWPGNIRELEQTLFRAALLNDNDTVISVESLELRPTILQSNKESVLSELDLGNLKEAQKAFTLAYVDRVLAQKEGSRAAAARSLGISERSLYRLLSEDSQSLPKRAEGDIFV